MNFEENVDAPIVTHGLTTFVDDESGAVATRRDPTKLSEGLISVGRITEEQNDIKSFLARPVVVSDGLIGSSNVASEFVFNTLETILALPMYAQKLLGFGGIRCTMVFTLQVNATRFVQGRYMLNFYPTAGPSNGAGNDYISDMWRYSLATRSQCPGVQIDLNTQTSVTLKVPFIYPYAYYPIRASTIPSITRTNGQLGLHQYQRASTPTPYTLWVALEDVELFAPTIPQMPSIQMEEAKSKGIGPVETAARIVKKSTEYMNRVPFLSAYSSTVGWAADITANVASAFGWSKPTNLADVNPIVRGRGIFNPNADGSDYAIKMSVSSKNEIKQQPGIACTEIDEMSFDYIKTIPSYIRNITWATTDAKEAILLNQALGPSYLDTTYTDNGNTIKVSPPCGYPYLFFKFFRGSFKFRLKIVKTEFHSGRLAIVFQPQSNQGLSEPGFTYAGTHYCNRHIIDVRYGNEWTFEVPYISEFPWLPCDSYFGYFQIWVENQLLAPASVSGSVNILVEVLGADDLEYAAPLICKHSLIHPSATTAQSGGRMEDEKLSTAIGMSKSNVYTTEFAETSMGETVNSYRQLLKRMSFNGRSTSYVTSACNLVTPFAFVVAESAGTPSSVTYPQNQPDFYSLIAPMYAMSRGSMRVKMYERSPLPQGSTVIYLQDISKATITKVYTPSGTDFLGATPNAAQSGAICATSTLNDGQHGEVQVPMYSPALAMCNGDLMIVGDGSSKAYGNTGYANTSSQLGLVYDQVTPVITNPQAAFFMRGTGDDYSLHAFVSTPPWVSNGTKYSSIVWN